MFFRAAENEARYKNQILHRKRVLSHMTASFSVSGPAADLETVCGFFHAQKQKGGDAMLFTSGPDRAFERLMQEKPGFDHYDGGGANVPEDCGSCRFYRPDWKYQ